MKKSKVELSVSQAERMPTWVELQGFLQLFFPAMKLVRIERTSPGIDYGAFGDYSLALAPDDRSRFVDVFLRLQGSDEGESVEDTCGGGREAVSSVSEDERCVL